MKKYFLLPFICCLFSCATVSEEKPAGLLSPEKITSVLTDIHIAETQVETMALQPDTAKAIFKKLQKDIYWRHKISEEEFLNSYNYYQEHLVQLDKIYEGLVDSLGMREIQLGQK